MFRSVPIRNQFALVGLPRLGRSTSCLLQPFSSMILVEKIREKSHDHSASSIRRLAPLLALPVLALAVGESHCVADNDLRACDGLFEKRAVGGNLRRCHSKLQELYKENSTTEDRSELCYRLARSSYNLIGTSDPLNGKIDKKELARCVVDFANEAREVAPNDFRSHYWCGIATQTYGEHIGGTKFTIERLEEIRTDFEEAHRLNPKDATTIFCMGSWCFSLADLSWMSKKMAATFFATPPSSTFEEALQFFLKAEQAEPGFWLKNPLMIAKTYEKLKDKKSASVWAERVLSSESEDLEDKSYKAEAAEILKRCSH